MPAPTEADVRHLLRRTEFVDRPERVAALLATASIADAVDDVLAVESSPPSVGFAASSNWERGVELVNHWFDRMTHDSPRPFQERMALFWHGHFCSDLGKVGSAVLMREQIDLWRRSGLGNLRSLARTMSTQVAMIRYLDNNDNRASSPNQNFARELMELFLLGVGNYNEADVEASTAAWTGHTDQWNDEDSPYRWRADWHDFSTKQYLGRDINVGGDGRDHGPETIDVVLGNGIVPNDATNVANRGRPTREVAAEYLSRKLWTWFATDTPPPSSALVAMRDALVGSDFEIGPWVRAMLTHDAFYSSEVKTGLVRAPAEFAVALMHATGKRAGEANFSWLAGSMGQRLLYPPNVSGWRPNGYWVNASAMEGRARLVQHFAWTSSRTYWQSGGTGVISLARGQLTNQQVTARVGGLPVLSNEDFVRLLEEYTGIELTAASRAEVVRYAESATVWERNDALVLILLAPEMHVA